MFCGLSAFPLTPMNEGGVDEGAFARLVERLVSHPSLPLPLRALEGIEREELESLLAKLELTE